jgi:hypothetical protein
MKIAAVQFQGQRNPRLRQVHNDRPGTDDILANRMAACDRGVMKGQFIKPARIIAPTALQGQQG